MFYRLLFIWRFGGRGAMTLNSGFFLFGMGWAGGVKKMTTGWEEYFLLPYITTWQDCPFPLFLFSFYFRFFASIKFRGTFSPLLSPCRILFCLFSFFPQFLVIFLVCILDRWDIVSRSTANVVLGTYNFILRPTLGKTRYSGEPITARAD